MAGAQTLTGKVAVVAGATRGAGRGIACMLGEAGATVYCAGRSSRSEGRDRAGAPASEAKSARPETIEETAERVDALGGKGIPVRTDFLRTDQVEALFARVEAEKGRLDILVNDVWGGDDSVEWGKPFWELSMDKGLPMISNAIHTHLIASRYGVPLLLKTGAGLIVEITDGNTAGYRGNYLYDLVKSSIIRLAFAQAYELRRRNVAAIAVTPGFLRSEAMLDLFGVKEQHWRDGVATDANFIASESPAFVGRAIAALAADPQVMKKSGRVFSSWDLSDEYGFTDLDGSKPHWGRHWEKTFGKPLMPMDEGYYAYAKDSPIAAVMPDWP